MKIYKSLLISTSFITIVSSFSHASNHPFKTEDIVPNKVSTLQEQTNEAEIQRRLEKMLAESAWPPSSIEAIKWALSSIHIDDREDVLAKVQSLVTSGFDHNNGDNLVIQLGGFPITKRDDVVAKAKLMKAHGIGLELIDIDELTPIIKACSISEIENAFKLADPLLKMIKGTDHIIDGIIPQTIPGIYLSFSRFDLLEVIAEMPPQDHQHVLNLAMPLVEICHKNGITPTILKILSLIPYAKRKGGLKTVKALITLVDQKLPLLPPSPTFFNSDGFIHDWGVNFCGPPFVEMVKALGVLPKNSRQSWLSSLVKAMEKNAFLLRRITVSLEIEPFLLQALKLPSGISSINFIQGLFRNNSFKEKTFAYWMESLNNSPDKHQGQRIVDFIVEYHAELGLWEAHPIVQEALRVGTLLDTSEDPLNPYGFYGNLKKKRAEVIDLALIQPPVEIIDGISFQFNPKFFRDSLPQYQVTFAQLPKHSKDFITRKVEQLDQLQTGNPTFNAEIEEMTENQSYEKLKEESLSEQALQRYLKISGAPDEKVPSLIAARFVASVAYLESLSDERPSGKLFSPQQEAFLKMLISIQSCGKGKAQGTNAYYLNVVPTEFRLTQGTQEETGSDSDLRIKAEVSSTLATEAEKMFHGQNLFIKHLVGIGPKEAIEELAHTSIYLQNLVGDVILGLSTLQFDSHTQMLYKKAIERSKLEVVQTFFKYFPASNFVYQNAKKYELGEGEAVEQLATMGILNILPSAQPTSSSSTTGSQE